MIVQQRRLLVAGISAASCASHGLVTEQSLCSITISTTTGFLRGTDESYLGCSVMVDLQSDWGPKEPEPEPDLVVMVAQLVKRQQ